MKISNLKFQISNLDAGFTLIELLAVMIILVTVSTVIGGILSSSLRNSSKTNVMNDVKQNGYFAIAQMTKTLRFAKSLDSPYPCPMPTPPIPPVDSISVTSVDGEVITFSCDTVNQTIKLNRFPVSQNITTTSPTPTPTPVSILDTSVVRVASCSFTCTQDGSSNFPIIDINFALTAANTISFAEKTASATAVPFQTSVSLMNVSR